MGKIHLNLDYHDLIMKDLEYHIKWVEYKSM
jgi:hypothetical protein